MRDEQEYTMGCVGPLPEPCRARLTSSRADQHPCLGFAQGSRRRQTAQSVALLSGAPPLSSTYHFVLTRELQLYMNRDRSKSEKALIEAAKLGYRAVIVTVDTPFPGNRELDLRTGLDANA